MRAIDRETVIGETTMPCLVDPEFGWRPAYELVIWNGKLYQAADVFSDTLPPFRYYQVQHLNADTDTAVLEV